jgi:hypothetical protein
MILLLHSSTQQSATFQERWPRSLHSLYDGDSSYTANTTVMFLHNTPAQLLTHQAWSLDLTPWDLFPTAKVCFQGNNRNLQQYQKTSGTTAFRVGLGGWNVAKNKGLNTFKNVSSPSSCQVACYPLIFSHYQGMQCSNWEKYWKIWRKHSKWNQINNFVLYNKLKTTNTIFRHKDSDKYTWTAWGQIYINDL